MTVDSSDYRGSMVKKRMRHYRSEHHRQQHTGLICCWYQAASHISTTCACKSEWIRCQISSY